MPKKLTVLALVGSVVVGFVPQAVAQHKVFTECAEVYQGPGKCGGGGNLPASCDNIHNMRGIVNGGHWGSSWSAPSTSHWEEGNAFPHDWIEADDLGIGGEDHIWADAHVMSVWSGHGVKCVGCEPNQEWAMSFGAPNNGVCHAFSPGEMFFWEQSGQPHSTTLGAARFIVQDASCSAHDGELSAVWMGCVDGPGAMINTHQVLAFMNSPNDQGDRLQDFATKISEQPSSGNRAAWIHAGLDCHFGFCDDNSPLAITKGQNSGDAASKDASLSVFNFLSFSMPGCDGWYVWTFNSSGGRC
jgi:hypothetical protein